MNINKQYIALFSLTALLTACSEKDMLVDDPSTGSGTDAGKTAIELSVGGVDAPAMTRAVITDGTNKTMKNFDVNTKIFMVIKSEKDVTTHDGYEYKGDRLSPLYTVTRGEVTAGSNVVTFDTDVQKRYWDDAHARSSQLDVWAYAQKGQSWTTCTFEVPNQEGSGIDAYKDWSHNTANYPNPIIWSSTEIYPAIRKWKVCHHDDKKQTQTSVMCQDLLFSNNLTNNLVYNPSSGAPDNRLKFNFTTHKFPQSGEAQMYFYHALSKITIHIKKGEGFTSADRFAFTTGNVILKGFNTEGLFNIKTGQFEYIHEHYDIPQMYRWATPAADYAHTLEALVIPNIQGNTAFPDANSILNKDDASTCMEFIIDNNKYEISQGTLFTALDGTTNATTITKDENKYVKIEPGKNYVFTFTIGKSKISNITAQVADWENVNADPQNLTNARIKLQLEERGQAQTSDVAFYMKDDHKSTDGIDDNYEAYDWKTGYKNMSASYGDSHWTSNLFWNTNKEFYHFRALMPDETTVTTETSEGDYATLTSGSSYTDVRWGAPMQDDGDNETDGTFQWTYDPITNGFDNTNHAQIYKAIGATENPIKLILFHMLSDLTFNIMTTTGSDAVTLVDGGKKTKVEIVGFYSGGKVLLGTGLVKITGSTGTQEVAWNSESPSDTHVYKYGAVPQGLTSVKLVITTPDNNKYEVDLKDAKATTITTSNIANPYKQTNGKYTIDRWYPGFKYNYSFTLKKSGITNLQATIVQWETVSADNEDVQIK